jgi:acetylglutamate kinase
MISTEKEIIYLATIHGAQHIINNLLNELKVVAFEIENNPKFNKEALSMFCNVLAEANTLIEYLSNVDNVDDKIKS